MYYVSDANSSDIYQLTNVDHDNYATFGKYTSNQGWTFLPGGLILQYGQTTSTSSDPNVSVTFPYEFANDADVYSLVVTSQDSSGKTIVFGFTFGSVIKTGFTGVARQSDNSAKISGRILYWQVIGKA